MRDVIDGTRPRPVRRGAAMTGLNGERNGVLSVLAILEEAP